MMRMTAIAAMALQLAACASITPPVSNYQPSIIDHAYPAIGKVTQASVGEAMVVSGTSRERRGMQLAEPVEAGPYTLSAGFYPKIGEDERYSFFSYRAQPTNDGLGYIPAARNAMGIWINAPDALRIERATGSVCLTFVQFSEKRCTGEARAELHTREELAERDLLRKLIYQGRTNGRIRVKYWEQSGHPARPESSSELTLALGPGQVIEYRGARLRVLAADESSIRFVALSNFADYWRGAAR